MFAVRGGDVTSSGDVSMSAVHQRRPLATGNDMWIIQDGGGGAAEAEEDEDNTSLCWKNDHRTSASISSA